MKAKLDLFATAYLLTYLVYMEISYTGLDGQVYSEQLELVVPEGVVMHVTPTENVESILERGLLLNQPPNKLMVNVPAIFCTIPSVNPSTNDLFRVYPDWSIIVLDTKVIPDQVWYADFLAADDSSNHAGNRHILTLADIQPGAITKVVDLANVLKS